MKKGKATVKKRAAKRATKRASKTGDDYKIPSDIIFKVSADEIRSRSEETLRAITALDLQPFRLNGVAMHWPNFFTVLKIESEHPTHKKHLAILDGDLAQRFEALTANFKSHRSVFIAEALKKLERTSPENLNQIQIALAEVSRKNDTENFNNYTVLKIRDTSFQILERVVSIVNDLKSAIGPDLHKMRYFRKGAHKTAAEAVIKNLTEAVQEYNRRELCPEAHGNAETYPFKMGDGEKILAPLPWLAIEFSRRFVEKKLKLPAKLDVRLSLIKEYPGLKLKELPTWTKIWKLSGLDGLKAEVPFAHPRNNRKA